MIHRKMTAPADSRYRKTNGFGCGGCRQAARHSAQTLGLLLAMLMAQSVPGAELQSRTLAAWENYIRLTEQRVETELGESQNFLAQDFLEDGRLREARALLKSGQVSIRKMTTVDGNRQEVPVPDGMIHHWLGGIFVPDVKLDALLKWIQDYDQHERYFMEVEKSQLLSRDGPEFQIFYRLRRKKVITVFYNTLHTVVYRQKGPQQASSRSATTRIAEIDHAGESGEAENPVGDDRGFLWRLNSYWRFLEADGGVYVECESVSLSRSIPFGLGWLIKGYVESIPRESLENTLTSIRDGIKNQARP